MIVGSLYVTGGALLFGAPVGILAGIYLARFCPVRLRKIIEPMIGLMAGVPSIVYGFFGLTTLVPLIREMFGGRGAAVHPDGVAAAGHHDSADHHSADLRRRQSRAELLLRGFAGAGRDG